MDLQYFKNTFSFSQDSDCPMYAQLIQYFTLQIQNGTLKPGTKLISEQDLCDVLKISRTTVRQAMNQLVLDGLIIRRAGKGSFVLEQKMKRSMNYLYNFSADMRASGFEPSSYILCQEIIPLSACADLNSVFSFNDHSTKLFHLKRIRCANTTPILVEETYIPYDLCQEIEKIDFSHSSLYSVLSERYNLNLYHATESIEAVLIDEMNANFLKCETPSAGYHITRKSYLDSGWLFEYTTSISRADRCLFEIDLYKNNYKKIPVQLKRQLILTEAPYDSFEK